MLANPTVSKDAPCGPCNRAGSLRGMSARALTSRLVHEVQHAVQQYVPRRQETDKRHLSALAKEVLASIDVRDLKGTPPNVLVAELEDLLGILEHRAPDEIKVRVEPGSEHAPTIVEVCLEDQPFLVSTVRSALAIESYETGAFINAIVKVRRDAGGRMVAMGAGANESLMRISLVPRGIAGDAATLRDIIALRLKAAQAMVADFRSMKAAIFEVADTYFAAAAGQHGHAAKMLRETEELLRWLCEENCVLLAVERYDKVLETRTLLGISRVRRPPRDRKILGLAAHGEGRLARFERSKEESPVHRTGKPGHLIVTRFGADGQPVGCLVIDLLFTYKALHTPPEQVPVIRLALDEMLADRQVQHASDRGRNITNAFNSLPLEYLLSQDRESIWELTDRILRAEAEGGSDVHIRVGEGSRFAFVVVALPRWQFSEELRLQVQEVVLDELGGTYADYGVYIDRYDNAVIHFFVTGVGTLRPVDTEDLRQKILAFARSWSERLTEAVDALGLPERAHELVAVYESAFTDEHKRRCSVRRIARDIECLEKLRLGAEIECDLYVSEFGDHPGSLNVRLFSRQALSLSRELPVLSNFGFDLIDQYSREVRLPHMAPVDMDNFRVDVRPERIPQILERRGEIVHALAEVFAGRAGDDDLNRLIVGSSLGVREVEILRAYVAYLWQLGVPFASELIRTSLVEHASVAEALVAWLAARFDPRVMDPTFQDATEDTLQRELREVTDYTADRVLSAVAQAVRATRRTNAYVADPHQGEALAFKVASSELAYGPHPRPYREIWVYHPEFEGVHLRGGRVARGGIRFSDRPEDFRTEIHDLMSTQMVKNVLIVPMGAKGGFVLRHPPSDRDAMRQAGDFYYQIFVRALLSLTDNVVDGQVQHPSGIAPFGEGDDAYLVVAADKGTAHLSDTANAISMERGFWLDDAFASGGSQGYDHKKTGITARGAWEVCKRSFRELGVDPERDQITVVGVGDMSGDVFGNGLLRSQSLKLVAAFNHIHIFIDPDPDPHLSFAERHRLFALPRSTWEDYDRNALSEGGGVYARKSKVVPLSAAARTRLGLSFDAVLGGDDVIRAILKAPVDLIWMGGIGTYVKAKDESHAQVGDKANDGVRVDAADVRCRVLAEGANLAITDRGRVEYARTGGQNYNAFLDNSGGVDTSDHEVNLKILFAPLLRSGAVTREQRNVVLAECEPDIVHSVLANNRAQSRMVSFDERRSRTDLFRYARTMRFLAESVPFDPSTFSMPTTEELQSRQRKGRGLFKTEAAVLCSHAKMLAYRELLEDPPLPERFVAAAVRDYFPARVRELAGEPALDQHLLRREIATTMIVNGIIDNAGATALSELQAGSGRSLGEIVVAQLQARAASGADALLHRLYAQESARNQAGVYEAMQHVQMCIEDATYYLLDPIDLAPLGLDSADACPALVERVAEVLPPAARERTAGVIARLVELGVDPELAERVARLRYLSAVLDAVRRSCVTGRSAEDILRLRLAVADALHVLELQQAIDRMDLSTPWDGPAVSALRRHLSSHLHQIVHLVEGDDVAGMIERYRLAPLAQRFHEEAKSGPTIAGLVMLDDSLRRGLASPTHPTV